MPNGGPDNCGECRFNTANGAGPDRPGIRDAAARCEIRGIPTGRDPMYTYCANFHTGARSPQGPVFASTYHPDHDRIPWHGDVPPELVATDGAWRITIADDDRQLDFESVEAYRRWWRTKHPGESDEYPWALHKASLDPRRRASGHGDRIGFVKRLRIRRR
jgi:hypothetical protein